MLWRGCGAVARLWLWRGCKVVLGLWEAVGRGAKRLQRVSGFELRGYCGGAAGVLLWCCGGVLLWCCGGGVTVVGGGERVIGGGILWWRGVYLCGCGAVAVL